MLAELVRPGWTLTLVAAAAGAAAFAATPRPSPAALPPVTDTDQARAEPEVATLDIALGDDAFEVSDHARYLVVDLDRDGTPELVARTEGDPQELVVVEAAHRGLLARIPFGAPGNPCASDFTVDGNTLVVHDYLADGRNDSACSLALTHGYTMSQGLLVEAALDPAR
jgi:hypothetical protein